MKAEQFEQLVRWFGDYVQRFYSQDGDEYLNNNLRLKETHTHRVCGEARMLADALKLNDNDTRIAETIALLHDIGRFEQFKKYRTYKDTTSEDHSVIGLRVISQERILEELDLQERTWIERAVEYHNKKLLPEGLDGKTELFSKIIRDADKLDIYFLITEKLKRYYISPCTFQLELEFPDDPRCSPQMLEAVEQGRQVDYSMLRTINDAILLQLGWVHDLYFDATLRRIVEKRYLEQYISWLPDTDDVKPAIKAVMQYVEKRLKT
jgi:putative nucleotidyltransferase with HDIG domain